MKNPTNIEYNAEVEKLKIQYRQFYMWLTNYVAKNHEVPKYEEMLIRLAHINLTETPNTKDPSIYHEKLHDMVKQRLDSLVVLMPTASNEGHET
jgi:hypothetical protein